LSFWLPNSTPPVSISMRSTSISCSPNTERAH
jgi:hypothetical protein